MKSNPYYTARAQAAYAAAEAADDPHDQAAYRAAARTWEQLAKPATQTYSMQPHRLQLAALKRDVAEAINAPASAPAEDTGMPWCEPYRSYHYASAPGCFKTKSIANPVTIEF